MPPRDDPYFKRRLSYTILDHTLEFDTAALLSSAHAIDPGVDLLLQTLLPILNQPPQAILDLGCNYGQSGLVLAKIFPSAQVTLTDKDLLAVRYSRFNCELNQLANVEVLSSLGVNAITHKQFDLIVTDLPTKIGDRAIEYHFLLRPLELLHPNGSYWIVADSQINRLVPGLARKHQWRLTEVTKRKGKIIYTLRPK